MTTEYKKRLCDLVNLEENSRDCVVLAVKPETQPLDLICLGGFDGTETAFRMSKDARTTCISVFRDREPPYHMNYGSSNTLVGEAHRKVRNLVMECVNLDFGIFTHDPLIPSSFDSLVTETMGNRDLDSERRFTLNRTSSYSSLFVNGQHIGNIDNDFLETWLTERNSRLEVSEIDHRGSVDVDQGSVHRIFAPELDEMTKPLDVQERYKKGIDEAGRAFLVEGGWQGKDAAGVVQAFVDFIKEHGITTEPPLDTAVDKAKEKSAERKTNRRRNPRSPRPLWLGR